MSIRPLVLTFVLALTAVACAPDSGVEEEPWEEVAAQEGALRVCADAATVDGIDVSYWQEKIDWAKVATTTTRFAFVRLGYGADFLDPRFAENWAGAKAAGLVRGLYHYFRPDHDAAEQAQLVIDALAADPIGPSDLPAVLDVEESKGLSSSTIRARMKTWLSLVETATGKRPIIYTAAFMQNVVGSDFADYPLWVANYTKQCPLMPSGWDEWRFWQFSDKGSVSGIKGAVDRNVFNGTLDDLLAFAGGSAQPDPQPDPDPEPEPEPADPTAPSGLVPTDGSHVTTDSVTLSCAPFTGATSYEFEIQYFSATKASWSPYYTYSTTSPKKTYWPASDAAYRFRVRAKSGAGWSQSSAWSTFAFGGAEIPPGA